MIYNTRIAPSPTGDMHIGTARTCYFNWLAARASKGKFMLRIDDTDAERSKPECVDVIFDTMHWLGLDYDKLEYQSSRFDAYLMYAKDFIERGLAYIDTEGATRFRLPPFKSFIPATWRDEIAGDIVISPDDIQKTDEMVLMRSDGSPTYNWASVIDDGSFGINYVIRGTDHISNTAKQVILWKLLGFEIPKLAHVGLIGVSGHPLSKREGAASMLHYREKGYDSDAMLNFLARMGWGPRVDDRTTRLLPRERMVEMFLTGGSMKSSLSNLDMDKLESFDRKYKAQKKVFRTGAKLV